MKEDSCTAPFLLTFFLLLQGCDEIKKPVMVRNCAGLEDKVSAFVLKCIENANPKSDEEPEGWLHQCESMGRDTICGERRGVLIREHNTFGREYVCDGAVGPVARACDEVWR